jgi:hypothetical protein
VRPTRRFGLYAVEWSWLSLHELSGALAFQRRDQRSMRPHRLNGVICNELGYLAGQRVCRILNERTPMETHWADHALAA